jgi:hypothetical protein
MPQAFVDLDCKTVADAVHHYLSEPAINLNLVMHVRSTCVP